jgi:predicted small secreted protein
MYKKPIAGLTPPSLMAAAPPLNACHTTAWAGQNISATGNADGKSAGKHMP